MARPVAPGLIQGAFRGLIAGAFVAVLVLLFGVTTFIPSSERVLAVALGIPILAATLGAADGLEARLESRNMGHVIRLLAPPAGVTLAMMVVLTVSENGKTGALLLPGQNMARAIALASACSLGLSLGLLIAGPHDHRATGIARALIAGSFSVLPLFFAIHRVGGLGAILSTMFVAQVVSLAYLMGHAIARPLGRQIARWLEPDESFASLEERTEAYKTHVLDWGVAFAQSRRTELESERRALLERALEAARAANDIAFSDPRLERFQTEAAERLALAVEAHERPPDGTSSSA